MSGFIIPGSEEPDLPAEIREKIEESVKRFEAKFEGFGMMGKALLMQNPAWLEDYRKEMIALAVAARESK